MSKEELGYSEFCEFAVTVVTTNGERAREPSLPVQMCLGWHLPHHSILYEGAKLSIEEHAEITSRIF